jgi:predicted esterase YcpF (UPF0227 family)
MSAKLIYLHGLNSAPQSTKAQQLKARIEAMPDATRPPLLIPALPHRPGEAMEMVRHMIDTLGPAGLTIIGSSLGGYYATWLAELYASERVKAVLINPTTGPGRDLKPYTGLQRNLYTGEEYEMTEDHLREFLALKVDRLTDPERYYLMVETGDEVLDYRLAIRHYAGAYQLVLGGGDHSFQHWEGLIDSVLAFAGIGDRKASQRA